jgi:SNF2 family DNA or RNA helicase
MQVIKHNTRLEVKFRYQHNLVSLVKSLDGRTYNPQTRSWFLPIAGAGEALGKLSRAGFTIDPEVLVAVKEDEARSKEAEALATLDSVNFKTDIPLYGYQKVGAAWLVRVGSGILGDQVGLGKTPQVLSVAEATGANKILVFCPSVLKHQWFMECAKFVPHRKVVVIEGTKKERIKLWQEDADYYIANYELLLRDFVEMNTREWCYIFADECTKISNPRAKQSKIIKKLRAKNKIAMSATLISNRAEECWNIMDFCNPGSAGNFWSFINYHCLKNNFGGIYAYQHLDELREKLKRHMIRRLKTDVLPDLPEKVESDINFVLSEEETELQKKIKQELLYEISKADISKINKPMNLQYTIAKFQRLRMLADSLELIGENKKSTKLEVLKELLSEHLD